CRSRGQSARRRRQRDSRRRENFSLLPTEGGRQRRSRNRPGRLQDAICKLRGGGARCAGGLQRRRQGCLRRFPDPRAEFRASLAPGGPGSAGSGHPCKVCLEITASPGPTSAICEEAPVTGIGSVEWANLDLTKLSVALCK